MPIEPIVLGIDFDGTCVDHRYPDVGPDLPGAVRVLKRLVKAGHRLILWTMRSRKELADAVAWFANHEIPLYGANSNPDQSTWTSSPKAYANKYIDDAAMGAPLTEYAFMWRPGIDWEAMEILLELAGILPAK